MKKIRITAVILSLVLLFTFLCACGTEKIELEREEEFLAVLYEIENYHPGTAGSSLKMCNVALSFLDFAEDSEGLDTELLGISMRGYLAALDEEEREYFKETVDNIKDIATQIFENGIESMKELISDAGNRNRHESYTRDKYEAFMALFDKILK